MFIIFQICILEVLEPLEMFLILARISYIIMNNILLSRQWFCFNKKLLIAWDLVCISQQQVMLP